jgi:hypothetical protein
MQKSDFFSRLGFSNKRGGNHLARTMMLNELRDLLAYVRNPEVDIEEYKKAIEEDNCLGKRSGKSRTLTFRHLSGLYSLDRNTLLFRAILYFWNRDIDSRPLLALLCTYARDPVFRSSAPFILRAPEGKLVTRESLEAFIDNQEPGRFSKAMIKSAAQNISSTWTQSGHLYGRVKKIRAQANPTAGSVSYALLLGYLSGARGQALFQSEYAKLLDCSFDNALELAEEASRKGWIVFNRVGDVIEVLFPHLINQEEMEWVREQG